jgi:hypothetical protein
MANPSLPRRPRELRRFVIAALFVGILAFELLMPIRGIVMRWHDGDADGTYRYSWHMYSTLDKRRGN